MAVDPTQRSFLEPNVLARLAAMPLFARRPMQGNVSGRHTSPHRGTSVEFAEYRKYVPGDDLRRLDWRAHGRTDRYYIKEFEADTNLRCCLVVDTSGSMKFGSTGTTKFAYAQKLAAAISYLAIQQGDAAGMACVADGIVTEIPAKRNPAHLRLLFDLLERAKPTGPTRLIESLHELAETIRQRALIILISDFFVPPEELRQCFEHFRFRKHDLAAFHLLDPQEIEFKFQRPTRFLDPEGGPAIFAEPSEIADRYHRAMNAYLTEVKHAVDASGVDYHRVLLNESYDAALMRFLAGRSKAGGVR
ncbi:DUF58 domain-containing protein [Blastopirellula sp. JC732]|uniref:DUF58 domain-containing protein n=1 Tax=Blastopirellula sediminis TaxID=2894196 RepID=A0A9X1SDX6_9BACT|nr:DUF58 domain-containing protein [Blastopirellula sediminis]MCC9608062.1 DUF58 domain-containing protein [Blastopirellula sediminis]MCC9627145.1 DUF58 domain-containing protein [Blastopirellula sediminis]